MSEPEIRLQQLQQIPVFALRQAVYQLLEDYQMEGLLHERFRTVLNRRPRNIKRAVQRLTREHLTRLIDACPEITDDHIRELFEEYRYGTNPLFYIYLFDTALLRRTALQGFRPRFDSRRRSAARPQSGLERPGPSAAPARGHRGQLSLPGSPGLH